MMGRIKDNSIKFRELHLVVSIQFTGVIEDMFTILQQEIDIKLLVSEGERKLIVKEKLKDLFQMSLCMFCWDFKSRKKQIRTI